MKQVVWRMAVWVAMLLVVAVPGMAQAQQPTQTHVVQTGENLFRIGLQYGFSVEELALANNISDPGTIYVGQVLVLPVPIGGGEDFMPTEGGTGGPVQALESDPVVAPAPADGEIPADVAPYIIPEGQMAAAEEAPAPPAEPSAEEVPAPPPDPAPVDTVPNEDGDVVHVVQPNQSLAGIAVQYGVSWAAIAEANGITNPDVIYGGQELVIPDPTATPPADYGQPPAPADPGKMILVDLSDQRVEAYQDGVLLRGVTVSTGLPGTPTVTGDYAIYAKLPQQTMSGPGYYLPGVPWVMYFYQGYAIHGTYWHSNFGTPMSHGCVNLPTDDAAWFYDFASVGTLVRVVP